MTFCLILPYPFHNKPGCNLLLLFAANFRGSIPFLCAIRQYHLPFFIPIFPLYTASYICHRPSLSFHSCFLLPVSLQNGYIVIIAELDHPAKRKGLRITLRLPGQGESKSYLRYFFYNLTLPHSFRLQNSTTKTLDIWKDVHPSIVTMPMEWAYKMPYGFPPAKRHYFFRATPSLKASPTLSVTL